MKKRLLGVSSFRGNMKKLTRILHLSFVLSLGAVRTVSAENYPLAEKAVSINNLAVTQQQKSVNGKVTDAKGSSMPGVSIVVKGTTIGTNTDVDGNFQLSVPANATTLVFSFVGMKSQEVAINGKTTFSVILEEDAIGLEEVVAIGYGNQQKKDITGAVSSVKAGDFNKGLVNNPGQLLKGKVSGVNVTSASGAPGAGQMIIIRGQGSIRQGTGPLFVVDGVPFGLAGTGVGTDPLNFINPEDIESMDVLKDASATAIYGSRGANGVILITTKKGKSGTSTISVASNVGVSNIAKKIPVFSADEFRKQVVAVGGLLVDRGANTDWQDELTRTAITNDHNLVMQGGTDKLTFRASLGYLDQQGIVINTGIKRYSGRVNATQNLMDGRLKIEFNLGSVIEKGDNAQMGTVVSNMLSFNPTYPARDANGNPSKYTDLMNPLIQADLFKDYTENRKLIANVSPSFQIIKGLVYKLNIGYNNSSSSTDNQALANTDPYVEGSLTQIFSNGYSTLVENYLTYDLTSGNHTLNLLGGHSYQKDFKRSSTWNIKKMAANGIEPRYNPGLGQTLNLVETAPTGEAGINELQSFFGRITYSYKGRYMLTGTVRADGSSKFGSNNRYGIFPSFAAGWRISDESFMAGSPFTNLKLRAGWGQTGNQEIPSKITQARYTTAVSGTLSYPLSETGAYPAGTTFTRLANPDIQWEVSTQTNLGVDFALLGGALSGAVDYFHKVSSNILLEVVPVDPIQPAPTTWTNVKGMTITNQGVEVSLDYTKKMRQDISVNVGGNISFINNDVEGSPYTIITTGGASGSGLTGATINGLINGYSIGSFYMKRFLGINETTGLSTFQDDPKDGGRMVVGSALPDKTYNFYINLTYKKFDLGLNFNGVSGNMIYNNTAMNKFYKPLLAHSQNTTAKATEFPKESITNSSSVSTRYLENGSFLRLNNMTLGYKFDTKALGIDNWAKLIRLSVTGQNLFVITKYSGFDPEVNQDSSSGGIQSYGIDKDGYPKARTFVVGLNVTF